MEWGRNAFWIVIITVSIVVWRSSVVKAGVGGDYGGDVIAIVLRMAVAI